MPEDTDEEQAVLKREALSACRLWVKTKVNQEILLQCTSITSKPSPLLAQCSTQELLIIRQKLITSPFFCISCLLSFSLFKSIAQAQSEEHFLKLPLCHPSISSGLWKQWSLVFAVGRRDVALQCHLFMVVGQSRSPPPAWHLHSGFEN